MNENEAVVLKDCSKCGKPLPDTAEFFYRLASGKLRAHCKDCHKKLYSTYGMPEEHKERRKQYNKTYYAKNSKEVYARYKEFLGRNPSYQQNWYQEHKKKAIKKIETGEIKLEKNTEEKLLGLLKEHNQEDK